MGLMLALLVSLLAVTAGIIAVAAMRNGVTTYDAAAEDIASRVKEQRRHIAQVGRTSPEQVR